ncbi:hypothetical protein DPMN_086151 [Dreissena polymorpha]|uniref:C1q domain-containing protein n=1 Tax=Dreissena polymorpha TaxID=45954 RepID=A0A9D3YDL3_DREPO|nr:hypothetical protein DPMN_086151 [Dreissena polymorpha]
MAQYEPDENESSVYQCSCSDQRDVLIENLAKSLMALIDKITEQDEKIKELTKRQDQVIDDNTFLTDLKKGELIKDVDDLRNTVTILEKNVTLLEEEVHAEPGSVAFFATLSITLSTLGNGRRLVFDNVITNNGAAYNKNNGSFVAPMP